MSAHIFVGQDSKITDVCKARDNSGGEFLGAFQDRVRERVVPTKLIADNAPMYRSWNIAKYLQELVISMWQCETKYQNQNPAENQYQIVKRHTDRTMDRFGPVVGDSKVDSKVDPVVIESEVGPTVVENNQWYHPKPNGKEYQSKPKKKKRNQRQWRNNKKFRWKDQPHVPSFPDHLLPIKGVPSDVEKELQSLLDRPRVHGFEQINGSVYYDSNGKDGDDDEDDESIFHDAIQVVDVIYDTDDEVDDPISYEETINNDYFLPVWTEDGATGVTIEFDGVLHAQYCHFGEIYYKICAI